ncbi:MAG: alpha-E domain-containing protein [Myxococcales bacterium]|jgi:uncharacterized alpha-E superfamily protein|nr:alpha-E domain-containing protein [Myxococcales bacterium]
MISRVADHAFWYGRYVERAESTARLLAVTHNLALDAELSPEQCWRPIVIVCGEEAPYVARFGADALGDREEVQGYMTWSEDNPSSLVCSTRAARENARSIREVVSLEVWETTNELHLFLQRDETRAEYARDPLGFYRSVRQSTQLCLGLLRSTMLHDIALDFIWLGVMLERVGQTARLLDVQHHALASAFGEAEGGPLSRYAAVETALWLSLLRACSGFEPFLKTRRGPVSGATVADFLVGEPRFPRSVRYCVHSAYERLCAIRPPEAERLPGGQTLARLAQLDAHLQGTRVVNGRTLTHAEVHALLTHVIDEVAAICDGIGAELLGTGPG